MSRDRLFVLTKCMLFSTCAVILLLGGIIRQPAPAHASSLVPRIPVVPAQYTYTHYYCKGNQGIYDGNMTLTGSWSTSSSGGYVNSFESCNGSFYWTLTKSSSDHSVTWVYATDYSGLTPRCLLYVYIPTNHAGAPHARYWIYDSKGYLGNTFVNQENTSGWIGLGAFHPYNDGPPGPYIKIVLYNVDSSPGWDLAADAAEFSCTYG